MTKKKIAIVTYSMRSGGTERVISVLCNFLYKYFDVYIITLVPSPSFYPLHPKVTLLHSEYVPKPTRGTLEALNSNRKAYLSIVKILRREHIDLVIGFLTSNNILATLAAKRLGIPVIISERNNPFLQSDSTPVFWKVLRRWVYPMANRLTVQTHRIKTFYTPFIEERKLVTIPNPINPDFNKDVRAKKENIILNVGRLHNQKGQEILISAFAKANLVDWKLHIVGEGQLRQPLTDQISDLGLTERVVLLGKKTDIAEHYASCKIFAFSSRYEGFPNALLEAMYFGLPCVSTDCPTGPAELIQDGTNGYLVPVDDADALAQKLQKLAAHEELRRTLGQAASQSVTQYHSTEIVEQWKSLIDGLLERQN